MSDLAHSGNAAEARHDALRAGNYTLLGTLLARPPTAELLAQLALDFPDEAGPLGDAWRELAAAAGKADANELADEYQRLFIGIGRGVLVPFASWYRSGTLMEQPLSALRAALARLGLERQEGVHEPEDHVAALNEVMALLITDGELAAGFEVQQTFYMTHMEPFIGHFWRDLESESESDFYRAGARLGLAFHDLERNYLSLPL